MNELEKQIEGQLFGDHDYYNGFKDGCDFILEKNLPVLFADWKEENENENYLSFYNTFVCIIF